MLIYELLMPEFHAVELEMAVKVDKVINGEVLFILLKK
jgi:hypothetical protein